MSRIRFPSLILAALTTLVFGLVGTAFAQAPLVVFGDMVYGHENAPASASCTLNNRFTYEQMVVWRIKVVDPATGLDMYDDELESVVVTLADGQVFDMTFAEHPPADPIDAYWTAAWTVPDGYPTGILGYSVVATAADGRTGELITFDIDSSILTIVAPE